MDQPRSEPIPNPAVRRLSLYLRQLETFKRKDRRTISSKQLGESLGLTDAQVRKDLAYFGQFRHPGIGYRVDDLISEVRRILGTDKTWNVLLVGAGNLGRALLAYKGFASKGFRLIAVFDADPAKVGKRQAALTIQPMSDLSKTIQEQGIRLGIIAVPATDWQDPNGQGTGMVTGLDAATGEQRWTAQQDAPAPAPVAISNDVVFHGGFDGVLHAYSLTDGTELWTSDLGASVSGGTAVADGVVIVGAATPQFADFIKTGNQIHAFGFIAEATPAASPTTSEPVASPTAVPPTEAPVTSPTAEVPTETPSPTEEASPIIS